MAMGKDDWFKVGKDLGFAGVTPEGSAIPSVGSWQRAAWERGVAAGKQLRMTSEPRKTPLSVRVEAEQAHWPQAAREHARLLADEAVKCLHTRRCERLMRSLNRLSKRYGLNKHDGQRAVDSAFPVSTQPHPDGPVTLGMLLRGE